MAIATTIIISVDVTAPITTATIATTTTYFYGVSRSQFFDLMKTNMKSQEGKREVSQGSASDVK